MVAASLTLIVLLATPLIALDMQEASSTLHIGDFGLTPDAYVADMFCTYCLYERWPSCRDENCAMNHPGINLDAKNETNNNTETIDEKKTPPTSHANKRLRWNTRNPVTRPILSGRKLAEGMSVRGFVGSREFKRLSAAMTSAGVKGRRIFRSRTRIAPNAYPAGFRDTSVTRKLSMQGFSGMGRLATPILSGLDSRDVTRQARKTRFRRLKAKRGFKIGGRAQAVTENSRNFQKKFRRVNRRFDRSW